MQFDSLFWAAMQSSLVLGLIHGINPCGHSWLVLAPFVVGKKSGRQVASLTLAFLVGTAVACLALGASLGAISCLFPTHLQWYIEVGTAVVLIGLGMVLIIKPHLLHHHDHDHSHGDDHHDGHHCHHDQHSHHEHSHNGFFGRHKATSVVLFGVGFVNMIIPCPTVAIMYGYALESGSVVKATLVFAAYALTTGLAVGGVIYAIYRIASLLRTLQQNWIESAIMRTAGLVTIVFSGITFYQL